MSVRLGFAVASSIDPDILLVDEVLAVGDASFRQKCMNRIQDMLAQGTSIIFVSHNLWLVQAVCERALYIEKGEVRFSGQTSEALDLYDRALNEKRAQELEKVEKQTANTRAGIEIADIKISSLSSGVEDITNQDTVEISVEYIAYRKFEQANLVVRILRSDGLTCCAMRTSLDNFDFSIEPGKGKISVKLDPIQLYGGSYYVQAVFRDQADAHTITNGSSEWFYVKGSVLTHQEMNGVFEPHRTWEQK
jgi:ABC-type glutathione transport system ATPase component